jgi:hypothetical protein
MTNLTHQTRADLRTRIQQGLDIAMHKEDIDFWQCMMDAVEDSASLEGALASIAEHQVICKAALARVKELEEGVWVRATSYHDKKEFNATYHCGEYSHPFVVEAFDHDPGEHTHSGGTPEQFIVKVSIRALLAEGSDR